MRAASSCLYLARLLVVLQLSLSSSHSSLPRRHSFRPAGERQPGSNAGACGRPDGTRAPKPAPRGAVVRGGRAGRRPESEGSLGALPSCFPGSGRGCMQGSGCASRGKPFPPRLTRWVRPGGLIRHFAPVPGPTPAPRAVWLHLPPRWPEGRERGRSPLTLARPSPSWRRGRACGEAATAWETPRSTNGDGQWDVASFPVGSPISA